MAGERITIFDTTLRDGEQSPGCSMNLEEKLRMARQLDQLGVDVIEAGFPIASQGDFEAVQAVAREVRRPIIAGLARATGQDVECAWQAVRGAARPRIHVFLATSDIHLHYKLKMTRDECLRQACQAVDLARSLCADVEFSPEDATRTDLEFLCAVSQAVVEAGATTVNLPDTVGYSVPTDISRMFTAVRERIQGKAVLSAHCHNDLGLAVANSIAAFEAGARQVECTINGIGERAGNASLEEIVMALRVRGDALRAHTEVDPAQIGPASRLVERLTSYPVPPNKAIVGANAFAHEAGIHQDGLLKDVATYQIIDPAELGLEMTLPLGKHSGRHAFSRACEAAGLRLDEHELVAAFARFKARADEGGAVSIHELVQEVTVS